MVRNTKKINYCTNWSLYCTIVRGLWIWIIDFIAHYDKGDQSAVFFGMKSRFLIRSDNIRRPINWKDYGSLRLHINISLYLLYLYLYNLLPIYILNSINTLSSTKLLCIFHNHNPQQYLCLKNIFMRCFQ